MFQTRSDNIPSLRNFKTFDEAYAAFKQDNSIYRISFDGQNWIPKYMSDEEWYKQPEQKLRKLSKSYAEEKSDLYWIHQTSIPHNYYRQWISRTHLINNPMFEGQFQSDCIVEVLSDEEFKKKFSESSQNV